MTILFLCSWNSGGCLKGVAWNSGGSLKSVGGGLYTDVITMLSRSTERVWILFLSSVCTDSTVDPSFTKIALPY